MGTIHAVPQSKGSTPQCPGEPWECVQDQPRLHLRSPAVNSSVPKLPVPAASSPSNTSSSSSLLHGKPSSCNF